MFSVYASTPFKFIIDGKPLYMHSEIVSAHSKPLDRMINGHMSEAQKGFAVLEDVDFETFNRFIQWSYVGYYSPASYQMDQEANSAHKSDEDEGRLTQLVTASEEDLPASAYNIVPEEPSWQSPSSSSRKITKYKKGAHASYNVVPKRSSKDSLKTLFFDRQPTIRSNSIPIPPIRANRDGRENYTEVFLSHARLFIFADKYDIQSLKTLAFENLHGTLSIFTLHRNRTNDIIELLRCVYESVHTTPGAEDLRALMTDYLGYEMDTLMDDENFKDLMNEDGGTLLGDYMKMVAKRI